MTSSTRQPRGSGSRRRAGRPAPGGAAYPAPRPSRQPMPRQSYRPASAKRPAKPQRRARKPHTIDMPTMCATLLLLLVGLIALFSASYSNALYTQGSATYFIARQLKWAAGGLIAMFLLSKWDYHDYKYLTIPAIAISVFLLILVLIPGVGTTTKGATRWLFGEGRGHHLLRSVGVHEIPRCAALEKAALPIRRAARGLYFPAREGAA